jgi:trimeric autotransporter adhesin
MRKAILAGILLVGGALSASLSVRVQSASAASWTVTDCSGSPSDPGSLPYAVANSSGGDTITFLSGLSCPPSSPILLTSAIGIGHNLTISGPGAGTMAVSGSGTTDIFYIGLSTSVAISSLTIEDGYSTGNGGGIYNDGALAVTNAELSGSNAAYGPYVADGGGAIYNSSAGTLTVVGSTISGNLGELGGGVFNSGTATIANSLLSDNTSAIGGGAVQNVGTLTTTNSTFTGNTGGGYGGGAILNGGGCSTFCSTLTVTDSTFSGNSSGSGGGGIANDSYASVDNSTFWQNTASQVGGAIVNSGDQRLSGSTLLGNSGSGGGNIDNIDFQNTFVVQTSILADSAAGGDCQGNGITDDGYNIDDDGTCGLNSANQSVSGSISIDGSLGTLGNNGGPTETVLPSVDSPVAGVIPVGTMLNSVQICPRTDQRGAVSQGSCTIGSVEPTGEFIPTTPAISNLPAAGVYGGDFTASVSTNGDGTTSVTSSSPSVCTTSGLTVSYVGTGTCTLIAQVSAGTNYTAASGTPQSFSVGQATPSTPTISNLPASGVNGGGFTATVSTNGDGTTSVTSSSPSVCTASGLTVSYVGTGNCTLTAQVSAGTNYTAASGTPQSFSVGRAPPTATIVVPSSGATLSGTTSFDAVTTNATSLQYQLLGGIYGYLPHTICTATVTVYGWACLWNSATVPNGTYVLVADAANTAGSTLSPGVSIEVQN